MAPQITESGVAASTSQTRKALRPSLLERSASDDVLPASTRQEVIHLDDTEATLDEVGLGLQLPSLQVGGSSEGRVSRSRSPPPVPTKEAVSRAQALSKKLSGSNIRTQVTETGDLMLDMTGYKSSEDEALRAEAIARKILAEELEGSYDIGALIGADERGNLWIYSSEEAKEAAGQRSSLSDIHSGGLLLSDSASDPGYHSDGERSTSTEELIANSRGSHAARAGGTITPPHTPPDGVTGAAESKNYAKTLRLTSEQLKSLGLRPGPNSMSFSVNKSTCTAFMYYWKYNVPIVISDIDGTITK